ncbi:chloride channel protein [Saccharolobus caldissimus]|uniref:Chloride channel protein n=1 Tax=Saccharolobus caldissimus TaxID=1702097 RepID=A0AAQ4CWE1_9CREN|nr:chloride channel protein [Saccharolobus caldissimus]BDC00123.1 chloride channel protein [Saccharolobus caldissimus]
MQARHSKLTSLPYFEKWFILGVIMGVISGLAATVFYLLLHLFEDLFLFHLIGISYPRPIGEGGNPITFTFHLGNYYLIPVSMAIGGLLSGLIVYTFAPEAEGHGTDAAIKAYHYYQGKIRWVVVPVKIIASAITIGSGGSAGREGPTAQFSAGVGSVVADLLRLTSEDRRRMVAVGIGAGIGTIFKSPIGGALLASEILYKRDLEPEVIYPGLVASAIGYTIFGSIFGFTPVFGYYTEPFNPLRLPMYAVLGVIAGLLAIVYVKVFYGVHGFFKKLKISNYLKPIIGALLASTIALIAPEVMATGYGWIDLAEYSRFFQNVFYSPILPVIILLILLPFLKIIATAFSIGSGGSGGVFAPGLFIGAFVGADVGLLFHQLFPSIVPSVAPFIIIGMAAFFSAAGKVPLSVIIMVTEMTGSLQLLPGAMVAAAISYLISGNYTIYQAQVPTKRDSPAHRSEFMIPVLESVRVSECKFEDIKVFDDESVEKAISIMTNYNFLSLPVIDHNYRFLGIVYLRDLLNADKNDMVRKYMIIGSPYVRPNSTLEQAWEIMSRLRSKWACVVEDGKYKGIVTMDNLIEAYEREVRKLKKTS